jgi:hypothetical protein
MTLTSTSAWTSSHLPVSAEQEQRDRTYGTQKATPVVRPQLTSPVP